MADRKRKVRAEVKERRPLSAEAQADNATWAEQHIKQGGISEPRKPGRLKGRIRVASDFDAPLPEEILAAFRGEGE